MGDPQRRRAETIDHAPCIVARHPASEFGSARHVAEFGEQDVVGQEDVAVRRPCLDELGSDAIGCDQRADNDIGIEDDSHDG